MLASDLQQIASARRADIQRFDGVFKVIFGTGQRSQVQHAVHGSFYREWLANVPFVEFESRVALELREIGAITSHEVVVAGDLMAFRNQTVT